MIRFAANLSLLWSELPYLDRFEAAAAAGFEGVEVLFPYDIAAKETARAVLRAGLEMVLINAPPPNYTDGPRGFAATPSGQDRFRYDMKRAFRDAAALKARKIHIMAGEGAGTDCTQAMIDNLGWAAANAPKGLMLTIEPLCQQASPGYFLNDYGLARDILEAVNAPNVRLQFDSFHSQMIHGDASVVFKEYADLIDHVQLGDAPKRSAPGTGDVNFNHLFETIRNCGYSGWISGEYHPGTATEDTLKWMQKP